MKEQKFKTWQIVCASVLCAIFVLGAILAVIIGVNYTPNKLNMPNDKVEDSDNPIVVDVQDEHGILLCIDDATTASDGTTSQTVTATVTPSYADATLQWSLAFKNPSSTWANDKNIDSYMTIDVNNDTSCCTVTCNEAFGEQIILTAVSVVNSSVFASCSIDYEKRIQDFSVEIKEKTLGLVSAISFSDDELQYTFTPTLTLGVGTIDPTPTYTYQFTDEFNSALPDTFDGPIGFVPNTTVTDINNELTFSKLSFRLVSNIYSAPVGYGEYQYGTSLANMLNQNYSKAESYILSCIASVKKAIKAYNGNVLKFTCSYTSSNGNGVTVSKVKEIPIGTCNFPSLEVSAASLDKTTMVF